MARRIKTYGGQKQTKPIKDVREIARFMSYLLRYREKAKTQIKRYQADRNWMMCLIGFNTAFRAEDLLQLRVCELSKGYVSIKENKTGKMQNFRMNKELHKDILDYIKRNDLTEYDYMFLGQKKQQSGKPYGYPITRQQGHKVVSETAVAVGISFTCGLHSLRKTFGYQYLKNGGNPETLMKMYNHDDYSVTKAYTMWGIDDAEKAREATYLGGVHKK